jgi:uncharacterized membrane protein
MAGLIAAVYAVLTAALAPISFGVYQVRIAEALTVLPFLTPAAIPGLFIGCLIGNLFGGLGWLDIVFGSTITLLAALATRAIYHLSKTRLANALAFFPAAVLWVSAAYLLAVEGFEFVLVGWLILAVFANVAAARLAATYGSKGSVAMVAVASLALLALAMALLSDHPDQTSYLFGGLALAGAWLVTYVMTYTFIKGTNPNILLAPLPPVLFNAFGVSAYLAPLIEVDYWLCVQMVGIGQMVACYLLGLPLLLILKKRKNVLF